MSWQRDYLDREGKHLMTSTSPRYDDLNALFINCTLKPSPELSHTEGLVEVSAGIMRKQGVRAPRRSAPSITTSRPACGRT